MKMRWLVLTVAVWFLGACSSSRVDETGATDSTSGSTDFQTGEQSAVTDALPPVSDLPPPPDVPGDSPVQENVDVAMTPPVPESLPAASSDPTPAESVATDVPPPPPVVETLPAAPQNESELAATPLQSNTEESAAVPESVSGDFEKYTVRSGDTLMKIAFEHYGDLYRWREIFENNRQALASSEKLEKGTELRLSTLGKRKIERKGLRYLIQPGDTLGKASHHIYGTPKRWRKLWEFNRDLVKDPNKIYAGFNLVYKPFRRLASTRQ